MAEYRHITSHHDGHGLNESIDIVADPLSNGGASHQYDLRIGLDTVALIQFQQGPRNIEGSIAGATEAALLAVLIDRLEGFQAGPFACAENGVMLALLYAAMRETKRRADERARRGVLGRNEK